MLNLHAIKHYIATQIAKPVKCVITYSNAAPALPTQTENVHTNTKWFEHTLAMLIKCVSSFR